MERDSKKYEILPGVPVPDIKTILNAASDFSSPGVEGIELKGEHIFEDPFKKQMSQSTPAPSPLPESVSENDKANLQSLGQQVAEEEDRITEESRKRMAAIKSQIIGPASIDDLSRRAAAAAEEQSEDRRKELEEKRKEMEAKRKEQEELAAAEEAKRKAREERRKQQQQALEDSLARKKKENEERLEKEKAEQKAREEEERKAREALEAARAEEERKAEEARLEAERKAEAEARAKEAAERDEEYKAWVQAKKEAASKGQDAEAKSESSSDGLDDLAGEFISKPDRSDEDEGSRAVDDEDYKDTIDDFSEFL